MRESGTTLRIRIDPRSISRPAAAYAPIEVPVHMQPYMAATEKIDFGNTRVRELSDDLFPENSNIVDYINNALSWTKRNIRYDQKLAEAIWNGRLDTQSASRTLQSRRGTCSEYANVFIALMRCKNVPARFVSGFMYGSTYHSWADVFLPSAGWIPVDPQMGAYGVSNRHIKLFFGVDFPQIGVKLRDIGINIKKR